MAKGAIRTRRWLALATIGVVLVFGAATGIFWGDLVRTTLDPKVPFQLYKPPPAPDYAKPTAWALLPADPQGVRPAEPAADVFFISPTTYDGGRDWNAPIDEPHSSQLFEQVMAPNYAGPFVRVGRLFAPRYRQASLYSLLTLREDAREARRFAYGDVQRAFRYYAEHDNRGRPFLIVGVEQGGVLGARLLADEVANHPALRSRLVAAYLIETVAPADLPPVPPCMKKGEAGCLAAWASVPERQFENANTMLDRALVWTPTGDLENLADRPALCFNPLLGAVTEAPAGPKLHLGAANATGLEWGARPAFLARQVSAQCIDGVLRVSHPKSASLRPQGSWADRRKAPGYNLFYADLEADAQARLATWTRQAR
jgi:hypothetical protein